MPSGPPPEPPIEDFFDDLEARDNVVGLFDLLLKIDRRVNPHQYEFLSETAYD